MSAYEQAARPLRLIEFDDVELDDGVLVRRCRKCHEVKPLLSFPAGSTRAASGAEYRSHTCRECTKRNARITAEFRRNGGYARMYAEQGGKCVICPKHCPPTGSAYEILHVDHDHATGLVRGLLCMSCNQTLGKVCDDVSLLLAMASYLSGSPAESR